MAQNEIIYKLAFSFLKRVSVDLIRELEPKGITYEAFFTLPTKELVKRLSIRHDHDFDKIAREEAVARALNEWNKIKNHNITPLFVEDDSYPSQLAETENAPIILYKLGDADLESDHILAVVGTRKPTPYGLDFCNKLVDEIGDYFPDALITSGLAYGIDAAAHKKALEKGITTVAVVAHGLNMIYPAAHRNLAKAIVHAGGAILSEYPFDTKPYRPHFLARNRIVAGISDATVVVESNVKGGAMSTANFAFMFNRDVMALPGRSSDPLSSGCNLLIRKNKAHLIESGADLIETTGWQPLGMTLTQEDRNLFPELNEEESKIFNLLQNSPSPLQMDQIIYETGFTAPKAMALLGELEFNGIIMRHPGNRFSLA